MGGTKRKSRDGDRLLTRSRRLAARLVSIVLVVILLALPASQVSAEVYYWDANGGSAGIGNTGTWDFANPPLSSGSDLWRYGSATGLLGKWQNTGDDIDAVLAGVTGTITLDALTTIYVNDITVAPDSPGVYSIAGVSGAALYLRGRTVPVIDVAGGNTLAITSGVRGLLGLTKIGSGILEPVSKPI